MSKKRRFVKIEGDVDIWQYGGTLFDRKHKALLHIEGLDGQPELWDWGVPEKGFQQTVWTISIDPIEGYIENWVDVEAVSKTQGLTVEQFRSQDILSQWCDIAHYYGWNELDQYPTKMNKTEFTRSTNGYT